MSIFLVFFLTHLLFLIELYKFYSIPFYSIETKSRQNDGSKKTVAINSVDSFELIKIQIWEFSSSVFSSNPLRIHFFLIPCPFFSGFYYIYLFFVRSLPFEVFL